MTYGEMLNAATDRLEDLQVEYSKAERTLTGIGKEIKDLAQVVKHLGILAGKTIQFDEVTTELLESVEQSEALEGGITKQIRQILAIDPGDVFSPMRMRTALEEQKFDLSKHKNAMATIHGVLKRLVDQGSATTVRMNDGKTGYRFQMQRR